MPDCFSAAYTAVHLRGLRLLRACFFSAAYTAVHAMAAIVIVIVTFFSRLHGGSHFTFVWRWGAQFFSRLHGGSLKLPPLKSFYINSFFKKQQKKASLPY